LPAIIDPMAFTHTWISWLQIARISALPTAISNVMLGYLLAVKATGAPFAVGELILLVLSSASLYSAGMILNDVFDLEVDRIERPDRPLPANRIDLESASRAGYSLLVAGVLFAAIAGWWTGVNQLVDVLRPVLVAAMLANCILAYDKWLKRTLAAPFLMGSCRLLNVLLGASTLTMASDSVMQSYLFDLPICVIAFALGIYVAGITMLARKEAVVNSQRTPLWVGTALMATGIFGYVLVSFFALFQTGLDQRFASVFPWLLVLIAFPVLRRAVTSAIDRTPKSIQATVISGLRTIIVFDAAFCFLAAPDRPGFALAVVSLLIPSILLGTWLRPT
jgi:4-hydroxybenzoate polyprenyltransferase